MQVYLPIHVLCRLLFDRPLFPALNFHTAECSAECGAVYGS